jgi:hypothetical protein
MQGRQQPLPGLNRSIAELQRDLMAAQTGRILRADHNYKTASYVRQADGRKQFTAVFTVMNESGIVLGQWLTLSSSIAELQQQLNKMAERFSKVRHRAITCSTAHTALPAQPSQAILPSRSHVALLSCSGQACMAGMTCLHLLAGRSDRVLHVPGRHQAGSTSEGGVQGDQGAGGRSTPAVQDGAGGAGHLGTEG